MSRSSIENILSDLVEIPSVTTDPLANNQVLDYVDDFLAKRGMYVERQEHDGCGALVATTTPTKTPEVMFVAHADVVAAPPKMFRVEQAGDKLLGRGVLDMKFAIAAYLTLTDELKDHLTEYDYGISIVTNEESAGQGVANLLAEGFVPRVAVLPDGGRDWQIERVAKGAWSVKITAHGVSAHGSRPWEGESASLKLMDALNEIRPIFDGQSLETDTLNLSLLSSGNAINQVPDLAEAALDIRVMSQATLAKIKKRVGTICGRHNIEMKEVAYFAPLEHDLTNPYFVQFAESIRTITGVESSGVVSAGASDAVYYDRLGIPCVVTRPPGNGHHADTEWISRSALEQFTPLLKHFLTEIRAK